MSDTSETLKYAAISAGIAGVMCGGSSYMLYQSISKVSGELDTIEKKIASVSSIPEIQSRVGEVSVSIDGIKQEQKKLKKRLAAVTEEVMALKSQMKTVMKVLKEQELISDNRGRGRKRKPSRGSDSDDES